MERGVPGLLIDCDGREWPARPETLERRFGPLRRRCELVRESVALGFVFVEFCRCAARVAFLPQFATRRAVARLAVLLAGKRVERVALSSDGTLRSWSLIHGAGPAIARVDQLVATSHRPEPRLLVGAQTVPLDRVGEFSGGRLVPALQGWNELSGRWAPEVYQRLERTGLLDHSVVIRRSGDTGRFVFEHWGRQRTAAYGSRFRRIARGRDIADQPNEELGRWNLAVATRVAADRAPVLLDYSFVMRTLDDRLVRRFGKRLMLPWRGADRQELISVTDVGLYTVTLEKPAPAN